MDDIAIIENKIYEIRGQKVMLDFDLAEMYGVETRALNQAVRLNASKNKYVVILNAFLQNSCSS